MSENSESVIRPKSMKDKAKIYFDIVDYLESKGPQTAQEIISNIGVAKSTFYDIAPYIEEWGKIKKINGKYSSIDYSEYDSQILEQMKRMYPGGKYPGFYNANIKKVIAIKIHVDKGDENFVASFEKVMKKLNIVKL